MIGREVLAEGRFLRLVQLQYTRPPRSDVVRQWQSVERCTTDRAAGGHGIDGGRVRQWQGGRIRVAAPASYAIPVSHNIIPLRTHLNRYTGSGCGLCRSHIEAAAAAPGGRQAGALLLLLLLLLLLSDLAPIDQTVHTPTHAPAHPIPSPSFGPRWGCTQLSCRPGWLTRAKTRRCAPARQSAWLEFRPRNALLTACPPAADAPAGLFILTDPHPLQPTRRPTRPHARPPNTKLMNPTHAEPNAAVE